MGTIATLAINLVAGTASFDKGMKRGTRGLGGLERTAKRVKSTLRTVGVVTAGAVVAGGAALALWTRKTMAGIDATGKLSDVLGVGTDNLIRWRHAADLSGVAQEQFDKGMMKFARNLGEAKAGVTTYAETFDMIGLSTEKLLGMDTTTAFRALADGIKGMKDPSQRAMVAMRLFGRSGGAMIKMLEDGSAGLEEMGKKAGATYSRLDAAKVEEARDAWTNLKRTAVSVGERFAVSVAPAVISVVDVLGSVGTVVGEVASAFGSWFGGASGLAGMEDVVLVIDHIGFAMENIDRIINYVVAQAKLRFEQLKGAVVDAAESIIASFGKKGLLGGMQDMWDDFWDPSGGLYRRIKEGTKGATLDASVAAVEKARAAMYDRGKQLDQAYDNFLKAREAKRAAAAAAAAAKLGKKPGPAGGVNFEAVEKYEGILTKLDSRIRGLRENLGPDGMKILDLRAMGLSEQQLANVWGRLKEIEALGKQGELEKSWEGFNKSLRQRMRTPAETLRGEMAQIGAALTHGLDAAMGDRAFADIEKRARDLLGGGDATEDRFGLTTSRLTLRAGGKPKDDALAVAKEQRQKLIDILEELKLLRTGGGLN